MTFSPPKIALVAGEASSDLIGADLIHDIKAINPNAEIIAVGGDKIRSTGVRVIQDNEVFSVMGVVEVLKDLPQLLKVKKQIVQDILAFKPDLFIGVDSPDLNFSIAKSLRKAGIPVVHYVSPSVWAWRPKRVYKMANFIDCLLTLFPFEVELYKDTQIEAHFVGHPLAKSIPIDVNKSLAKQQLGLSGKKIMALLPGSRNREIKELMPIFAATVQQLNLSNDWVLMSSNVSPAKIAMVQALADEHQINIQWASNTTELLKAADFTLLGSGTVALEAMLCKTPMVVAYKIAAITWFIVKTFKMMKLPYYSLPNVLYGGFLVPEVMQKDLTVTQLAKACNEVMNHLDQKKLLETFTQIHQDLLPASNNQAATTVMSFMERRC
jgi:lipid-A-disaccharide synthase